MNARDLSVYKREGAAGLERLAKEQIASKRAASSRRKDRVPRAPGESKAAKREEQNARTAALRAQAESRARQWGWVGELCGRPLPLFDDLAPLSMRPELCHLDGGGDRIPKQWIGNVLFEHHECHQGPGGLDKKPLVWLPAVKTWCERHGYPLPDRFRRLEAKAEAAPTQAGATKP